MFQHIKKLLLGNGLAQAIQLLSLLVLSRIYTPGDFGLLAQVQAIATFSTIVATLQLHLATPLSQSQEEARTLTSHTQSIALALTLVLLVPAMLLGRLETYSLWLTLAVALINTYNGYLIYRGDFPAISRFYVTRACLVVVFQLLFAFLKLEDGLVLGTLLAETLAALYLMKMGLDHRPRLSLQPLLLINTAQQHKAFSLYGTSQELVSVAAFYAPLILFGIYFNAEIAGQYAMASRLVWAPTVLVSRNIAQVLYHHHKEVESKLKTHDHSLIKKVTGIALIINISAFFLTDFFTLLLGHQWKTASIAIPPLLFWCSAFILSTPFRVLCRSLKIQKTQLLIDLSLALTTIAIFATMSLPAINIIWIICGLGVAQNATIAIAVHLKTKEAK